MTEAPASLALLEAAQAMRDLSELERERLIAEAGSKVFDGRFYFPTIHADRIERT